MQVFLSLSSRPAIPFKYNGLQCTAMPEAIAAYTISGLDDRNILARIAGALDLLFASVRREIGQFLDIRNAAPRSQIFSEPPKWKVETSDSRSADSNLSPNSRTTNHLKI